VGAFEQGVNPQRKNIAIAHPLVLSFDRQPLDPRVVRRACEALGLDAVQLPGPKSRV
jgi:hypothetical protein